MLRRFLVLGLGVLLVLGACGRVDAEISFNRLNRYLGFGWSDGYHAHQCECQNGDFCPSSMGPDSFYQSGDSPALRFPQTQPAQPSAPPNRGVREPQPAAGRPPFHYLPPQPMPAALPERPVMRAPETLPAPRAETSARSSPGLKPPAHAPWNRNGSTTELRSANLRFGSR